MASSQLPVIVVTGMAFEARIARGAGVETVFAARADLLERALNEAVARGCSGIVSFGTAGGLAPELKAGALIVADAVDGPLGRLATDRSWSDLIAAALAATPLGARLHRGLQAAVTAPLTGAAAKAALHRATGALAVDMESHVAGATAAAHGLPFAVCRAIVDPAWRTLPPAATAGLRDDGRTALAPILRELIRQPSQLGALLQLAGDARAARNSLVGARRALGEAGALHPLTTR
ncbi:phosphorylase [Paraburkholderia megapolitana]|uniref:Hopanoid-associated phosphorylase n=1 Tax=Paraburkholderia megapolitana TaxID=420953 RepID=A0A1I3L353_9BURK|nr:phosphorylase [Paraburkholderia megapolitana]QDQ80543.1 phosphorylase [Paraburkholderia megapolitana]SFI79056.1 hopanoid-associated phosphorylase [Paraburkholderia megapolitana]